MPRVLLLCEYPTLLGGERSFLATLAPVRAAGYEIVAAAPDAGPLAEAFAEQQIDVIPWENGGGHSLSRRRESLAEILRRHDSAPLPHRRGL